MSGAGAAQEHSSGSYAWGGKVIITIEDLAPRDEVAIHLAATLLVIGFAAHAPEAWPDMPSSVQLGSDDETNMTSLSGIDLYPDVWRHVQQIRNLRRHPYTFYQKCGFVIVGVVPDANGFGKPDILLAKQVGVTG